MEKVFNNAPVFSKLYELAKVAQNGNIPEIRNAVLNIMADDTFAKKGWQKVFNKVLNFLETGNPEFKIFNAKGNSKLPFYAFSVLPGVTCPGAGKCIDYCYSFKAWQYPSAYARQLQNTILMRFGLDIVKSAFKDIPDNVDFRLYVDGDFSNQSDVTFWFSLLNSRPSIRAYGYSKSFDLLLNYKGKYPTNYMVNISSDHNSDEDTVNKIRQLPITRGEFITVSVGYRVKSSEHGTKRVNDAIRLNYPGKKVFPCPGKCGTCTGKGHACGMAKLTGIPIAIAVH